MTSVEAGSPNLSPPVGTARYKTNCRPLASISSATSIPSRSFASSRWIRSADITTFYGLTGDQKVFAVLDVDNFLDPNFPFFRRFLPNHGVVCRYPDQRRDLLALHFRANAVPLLELPAIYEDVQLFLAKFFGSHLQSLPCNLLSQMLRYSSVVYDIVVTFYTRAYICQVLFLSLSRPSPPTSRRSGNSEI